MAKTPKPRRVRKDEGAELGVGTLIILIAVILIAAVAAGVLVQTVYKLQQQAEATADQALKEVATGLRVIASYGKTESGLSNITDLYLKVALSAGSPVINLYDLIIGISTGPGDVSLNYTSEIAGGQQFNVSSIRDTYPFNIWTATDVGITQGDIALLHVNLTAQPAASGNMNLRTQQDVTMLLIPKHGIPTFVMFTTPSVYSNAYEILG